MASEILKVSHSVVTDSEVVLINGVSGHTYTILSILFVSVTQCFCNTFQSFSVTFALNAPKCLTTHRLAMRTIPPPARNAFFFTKKTCFLVFLAILPEGGPWEGDKGGG